MAAYSPPYSVRSVRSEPLYSGFTTPDRDSDFSSFSPQKAMAINTSIAPSLEPKSNTSFELNCYGNTFVPKANYHLGVRQPSWTISEHSSAAFPGPYQATGSNAYTSSYTIFGSPILSSHQQAIAKVEYNSPIQRRVELPIPITKCVLQFNEFPNIGQLFDINTLTKDAPPGLQKVIGCNSDDAEISLSTGTSSYFRDDDKLLWNIANECDDTTDRTQVTDRQLWTIESNLIDMMG